MAAPVLDKVWQHNVNIQQGNTGVKNDDYAGILLSIKRLLTGVAPNGRPLSWTGIWTIKASSNGVVADLNDNWNSTADLVWSSSNRSWIVLSQSATGSEICLDCNSSSTQIMSWVWSHSAGFNVSSPVINARPIATDGLVFLSSGSWCSAESSPFGARLHVMLSTDGECTRVIVNFRDKSVLFWLFDLAKNPVSGWTNPSIAAMASGNFSNSKLLHNIWADNAFVRGRHGAIDMSLYMSSESTFLSTIYSSSNSKDKR